MSDLESEPEDARDALEALLWPDADLTDTILDNMGVVLRAAAEAGKLRKVTIGWREGTQTCWTLAD